MELLTQTATVAAFAGLVAFAAAFVLALGTRRRHVPWRALLRAGSDLMASPSSYLRPGHLKTFRRLVELGTGLWLAALLLALAFALRRLVPR